MQKHYHTYAPIKPRIYLYTHIDIYILKLILKGSKNVTIY